jgi:ParB family chromosome partitioning protein
VTTQRGGLGRGLSALIPGAADDTSLIEVPVNAVAPNRRQPRQTFDDETLEALARSIREIGVLQPIVVRKVEDDSYELVAGERRLRAARMAGLATVPAIIRTSDDTEALREALIENIHRADLAPLEQASAFQELQDELGATQEDLARRLGHSRPHIANTIRLLNLPSQVQELLGEGRITAAHGRALLSLDDPEGQTALAQRIAAEGLSVRQTEELVRTYTRHPVAGKVAERPARDAKLMQIEEALGDALGTRVRVQRAKRKGKIIIEFGSKGDLERIVDLIVD